jgi:GntR family transcriptional repressor for pyruvate dehydrogenase complex
MSSLMKKETALTPVRRESLSDLVARQLVRLVQDDLKEGERLPSERDLMSQLAVGRSSLREALRSLEAMGLVETRIGEGSFVTKDRDGLFQKPLEWGVFRGDKSLKDVMEARALLESAMIELVVPRITADELRRLEEAVVRMERTAPPDLDRFLEADLAFHVLLATATRNDVLRDTVNLIHRIIAEEKAHSIRTAADYRKSARFHRAIFEAIREKRTDAARAEMAAHMGWMKTVLRGRKS